MDNFWHNLPQPFFALAPMEAVTDVVFRHVIAQAARPDVFFTEFVNTNSYCSPQGNHSTRNRLACTNDEKPIVAQIWGNDPEKFAKMAQGLKAMSYSGVDINLGCPDKTVIKVGAGSALIKNPGLVREIIQATKEGGLPVSVKTRLGYSFVDEWRDWLTFLLDQNVSNITIHLRTKKEMSKVSAHYELIDSIKALRDNLSPNTLLTINGDIKSRQHGLELAKEHNIDGLMIGRGVFTNPFAFENEKKTHGKNELISLLHLHLDLFDKHSENEERRFEPLKRFFKIYIRDFSGASELRDKLMHTHSTNEVREILSSLA